MDSEATTSKVQPPGMKAEMEKNAGKMGMVKQAPALKQTKPKANAEK
jgi:hypothetical protein